MISATNEYPRPPASADAWNTDSVRTFAWDGLSFQIPATWDLSAYDYRGRVATFRLEDDDRIRLDAEWTTVGHPVNEEQLRRRCERYVSGFRSAAATTRDFEGLPRGWSAGEHAMADGRRVVTAFFLTADRTVFVHFRLHFEEPVDLKPETLIRRLAKSFLYRDRGMIPWSFYDMSFRLDRRWQLVRTSFLAGRKMMVFEWRLRRLYLWHLSFADRLLQSRTVGEWGAAFLNEEKNLRGPCFRAAGDDRVEADRARRYALGHFEEIGRWTFRYHVMIQPLPSTNRLVVAVLNHRSAEDVRTAGIDLRALGTDSNSP